MNLKLTNSDAECIVDEDEFNGLITFKWRVQFNGYVVTSLGLGEIMYLHKYVLNLHLSRRQVDHINRNKLDNRRCNLRPCPTIGHNKVNRIKYTRNPSSRFKGVSFHKASGKWRSYITVKNSMIENGLFESELEAAKNTNDLYKKYFGEFAVLNVID